MAQRDENPIIWKRGAISGTGKFILTLGIAVVCTILSVVFLLTQAGSIFVFACIFALLSWVWTFWNWRAAKRRLLIYRDRIVMDHSRPESTKVFTFSDITNIDVYRYTTSTYSSKSLAVHFNTGERELLDVHDPEGLSYLLTDFLRDYRAAHPSQENLRPE